MEATELDEEVGKLVEPGLPNITGEFGVRAPLNNASGAFSGWNQGSNTEDNNKYGIARINFDASRSSPIYGRSNTVQPPAIKTNLWLRLS